MGRNTNGRKRRFGSIRKLPSGDWQVRYRSPDGSLRTDDQTYPTRTAAEARLVDIEADLRRGEWVDLDAGQISLTE
jgi:hypothetical protein